MEDGMNHCWHIVGSYTQGDQNAGSNTYRCCFCGIRHESPWSLQPKSGHGPFVPVSIARREAPLPTGECPENPERNR